MLPADHTKNPSRNYVLCYMSHKELNDKEMTNHKILTKVLKFELYKFPSPLLDHASFPLCFVPVPEFNFCLN